MLLESSNNGKMYVPATIIQRSYSEPFIRFNCMRYNVNSPGRALLGGAPTPGTLKETTPDGVGCDGWR